jgi:hypothetical protein
MGQVAGSSQRTLPQCHAGMDLGCVWYSSRSRFVVVGSRSSTKSLPKTAPPLKHPDIPLSRAIWRRRSQKNWLPPLRLLCRATIPNLPTGVLACRLEDGGSALHGQAGVMAPEAREERWLTGGGEGAATVGEASGSHARRRYRPG